MFFSLNLITERLQLTADTYVLNSSGERIYERISLAETEEDLREEHTIYVCSFLPRKEVYRGIGFVLINLSKEQESPRGSDCLRLHGRRTLIETFLQVQAVTEQIRQSIEALKEAALNRASLQSLIEQMYEIFGNPSWVATASYKVQAIDRRFYSRDLSVKWRQLEDYGYFPLDLVASLFQSPDWVNIEAKTEASIVHSEYFYVPFINYNLRQSETLQGHLFILGFFKWITPGDIELANEVGRIINMAMQINDDFQHRRGSVYEQFMKDLLKGKITDSLYIRQQAAYLDLKKGRLLVGKMILRQKTELFGNRIASLLEQNTDVRLIHDEGGLTGIFIVKNEKAKENLIRRLEKLGKSFGFWIGVSDCFDDICQAAIYAAQAERAVGALSGEMVLYRYENCSVRHMLRAAAAEMEIVCPVVIRQMELYDRKNGTQYCLSLRKYLFYGRSTTEAAKALNIHRNTLTYRIERIQELFDMQLDDPVFRIRCLASLIYRMQGNDDTGKGEKGR